MVDEAPLNFVLKRCGAPSTYEGVGDVFRLTKERNVIGRNPSKTDFYLNSTVNKCLISRCHAEILVKHCTETGRLRVLITDSSLNGTFVNDIKIQGTVRLNVGDSVTFGHLAGPGVKPGMYNPQPDSEFRFMLHEASDSPKKLTLLNEGTRTFKEPISPLNRTIIGNHQLNTSSLCTQPPRPVFKQVSPNITQQNVIVINQTETYVRKNSQSPIAQGSCVVNSTKVKTTMRVEPDLNKVASQGTAGMTVGVTGVAKLISSPGSGNGAMTISNNDLRDGGQMGTSPAVLALNKSQDICSTPHRKVVKLQQKLIESAGSSKPLVYIMPKPSTSPSTPSSSNQLPIPKTPVTLGSVSRPEDKSMSKDSGIYDDFRELDEDYDDEEDMAVDSDGSDEDIFALASDIQDKVANFTDEDDNFFIPDSQNNNDHNENSAIPGLDSLDRSPGSPVFDRCASPVIGILGSANTSQQSDQKLLTTRNAGKRKTVVPSVMAKKQKTKANTKEVKYKGVQYEKIEVCSSIDCCKPLERKATVAWVQCDDCDSWYHVDCVGCIYSRVKQSSADFHCGCI